MREGELYWQRETAGSGQLEEPRVVEGSILQSSREGCGDVSLAGAGG